MWPRSLQARLLASFLVVVALAIGAIVGWTGVRLNNAAMARRQSALHVNALLIASSLRDPGDGSSSYASESRLQALANTYARDLNAGVRFLDTQLQVVSEAEREHDGREEDDGGSGAASISPELAAALTGNERPDIRKDASGQERMYVAAPVLAADGKLVGIVQLDAPTSSVRAEAMRTWAWLLGVGGVALLATAAVSVLLARQVAGPVRRLTRSTEALAAGNLAFRVDPAGPEEVQRLGHAFNRMAEQVQEMLASQQAFVANAAHELRTPLTSLRLRVDMLKASGEADPDLRHRYLEQVSREVDHLQRLVEHLLSLSRLDRGRELPTAPLDLAPLLYDLADEMAPLFEDTGLSVKVDVPPHLPAVLANADTMKSVVRNLLDNAIQYTGAGGRVALEAGAENGSVRISVSDTGQGIPAEHLPHLFERFYRVDKARSRRRGGAGLGLALVKEIVEVHGGDVSVRSEVGKGTTFTIRLPASAKAASEPGAYPAGKAS